MKIQQYDKEGRRRGFKETPSLTNNFVGWDGEGISGINPESQAQSYVMLCSSNDDVLCCETREEMVTGLSTDKILNFLCDTVQPNTINVGFALNYDVNQWLKDLSANQMRRLHVAGKVFYRNFNLEWVRSKTFRIRRFDEVVTAENRSGLKPNKVVTLSDTFSFFQQSFVKTLTDWEPYVAAITPERIERIHADKLRRNTFTMEDVSGMIGYCLEEVRLLAALMEEFRNQCIACDIVPTRWDGPGAIATALFKRHNTKSYKQDMDTHPRLVSVNEAAQYAFSGGRIEQVQYGHHSSGVYCYDIRSAYPSVIAGLPNLNGGTWAMRLPRKHKPKPVPFGLYKVSVRGLAQDVLSRGVMPIWARLPDGSIQYRGDVTNWVWTPEYELLLKYCPDNVTVHQAWEFQPADPTERPFSFVPEMYRERAELKKAGNPAQLILKLALNSMYGKTVQQKGRFNPDKPDAKPPYHQLEWAGFITSAVRAKMADAAYVAGATFLDPGPVISFETDGLICSAKVPLPLGSGLGEWEEEEYGSITYVQPGVYFLTSKDGKTKKKTRGFDALSISEEMVLEGWRNVPPPVRLKDGSIEPPCIVGTTKVFVGFGRASDRMEWRSWQTMHRRLALFPKFKRWPIPPLEGAHESLQPAGIPRRLPVESAKFSLKFPKPVTLEEFWDGNEVRQEFAGGLIAIEEGTI